MDDEELETFWLAIDVIESQNILNQVDVSSAPHVKQKDRSNYIKKLRKAAQNIEVYKEEVSMSDLAKKLHEAING